MLIFSWYRNGITIALYSHLRPNGLHPILDPRLRLDDIGRQTDEGERIDEVATTSVDLRRERGELRVHLYDNIRLTLFINVIVFFLNKDHCTSNILPNRYR